MRAYERLLKYARVYTTSDPNSGTHPSAEREFDLAHILVEDMKAIGIEDAFVDEHCYVYGTLPATPGCEDKPALGLIAHMDTAPDASGENVNPILHENYDGRDVTLPATGMVMKVSTFPFLKDLKGETLITTDGTTLLGADDKAGVAEILTAAETLIAEGRPHGKLCIAFTPDEEIGEGASLFDIPGFGADFAYTVDGGDVGGIEYENFNAASATVTVHGGPPRLRKGRDDQRLQRGHGVSSGPARHGPPGDHRGPSGLLPPVPDVRRCDRGQARLHPA